MDLLGVLCCKASNVPVLFGVAQDSCESWDLSGSSGFSRSSEQRVDSSFFYSFGCSGVSPSISCKSFDTGEVSKRLSAQCKQKSLTRENLGVSVS